MRITLLLGLVNGIIFSVCIGWLLHSGFPPVAPVVLLVITSFATGLMFGSDE